MKQATLIFLIKPETKEICLGMKKRGFGVGKWNGFGGKVADGESVIDAAIREIEEETRDEGETHGVKVTSENLTKVAVMKFTFPNKADWGQEVHAFLVDKWEGEPVESEEMSPQWFKYNDIPYSSMWEDDAIWLPRVLKGEKLSGEFSFEGDKIINYSLSSL